MWLCWSFSLVMMICFSPDRFVQSRAIVTLFCVWFIWLFSWIIKYNLRLFLVFLVFVWRFAAQQLVFFALGVFTVIYLLKLFLFCLYLVGFCLWDWSLSDFFVCFVLKTTFVWVDFALLLDDRKHWIFNIVVNIKLVEKCRKWHCWLMVAPKSSANMLFSIRLKNISTTIVVGTLHKLVCFSLCRTVVDNKNTSQAVRYTTQRFQLLSSSIFPSNYWLIIYCVLCDRKI